MVFSGFSIAVDELTDATDSSQLFIVIHDIDKDFEITEELAALQTMKTTTTGDEIFSKVEETLSNFGLQ